MRLLSEMLAERIKASGFMPDSIVCIIRGGMVPAINLSDVLGVYDLLALRVRHWGSTARVDEKAVVDSLLHAAKIEGKKVLLVDDVTDTGDSMVLALENVHELKPAVVKTAAIVHKASSRFKPDYYVEEVEEWRWIIFPWNLFEDLCCLLERAYGKEDVSSLEEAQTKLRDLFSLEIDSSTLQRVIAEFERRRQRVTNSK